ncbi:hypothetical protein DID78_01990 [Candidatus Marinamargulisbacteria bacterium SCGC AG-343-D04]|nr:hypothetical protein DID78_01990 [Candidatus Marinamargulisbacteria bacterium SCGC AG-343-D04]
MSYKSIIYDLKTKEHSILSSKDVNFSIENSLSVLRGQSFFTSAVTIHNDQGTSLVLLDAHYERFQHSYRVLFEKTQYPITYDEFKMYIEQTIKLNSDQEDKVMQCLIFFTAGQARSIADTGGHYSSGFGGDLESMTVVMKAYSCKPDWCFDDGIHTLSKVYQRPFSVAKPTQYLGGVEGQHVLDALNTASILYHHCHDKGLDNALSHIMDFYETLTRYEQQSFRLLMKDIFADPLYIQRLSRSVLQHQYGFSENITKAIDWIMNIRVTKREFEDLYYSQFPDLKHEVIFKTDDEYILEGSTFSLMGINQDNECVFIPLRGNSSREDDLNTGYILQSTSIVLLQEVLKQLKTPYQISSIRYDDLFSLKALYSVSTTRFKYNKNSVQLVPIRSIDHQDLPYEHTKTYELLMKGVYQFIQGWPKAAYDLQR